MWIRCYLTKSRETQYRTILWIVFCFKLTAVPANFFKQNCPVVRLWELFLKLKFILLKILYFMPHALYLYQTCVLCRSYTKLQTGTVFYHSRLPFVVSAMQIYRGQCWKFAITEISGLHNVLGFITCQLIHYQSLIQSVICGGCQLCFHCPSAS